MAKHTTTKPEESPTPDRTLSDDELRSQGKTTLEELEAKNAPVPADKPIVIDESKKKAAAEPAPEAPSAEAPAQPPTQLAAVQAEVQAAADAGQPDPLAQMKISGATGAHGSLSQELAKLPPIAALDGLKANAAAGYYRGVGKEELIATLKGLPFEDESARVQRDWLVQRAESGEFSRG